jgi:hypothetical protein
MQWGGHIYGSGNERYRLALATSLSTVLRTLDIDVISGWNIGHNEYWGKAGHYKVAATACTIVEGSAAALFAKNAGNIAFTDEQIAQKDYNPTRGEFVPLADVADLVWRFSRKKDEANHFADMDQPGRGGKTLLDLTKSDANIDPKVWNDFYDVVLAGDTKAFKHRGALPFRVWQMFDAMVADLKSKQVDRFVCGAGTMAHYVGDACQPLHVSRLHHGRNAAESKVHATYETQMLDRFAFDLVQEVKTITVPHIPHVTNGVEAAKAVIELMRRTFTNLPPEHVIEVFVGATGRNRLQTMWNALHVETAKCIADGARTLACIWESAWAAGGGDAKDVKPIPPAALMKLYKDATFVPSAWLPDMIPLLKKPAAKKRHVTGSARPSPLRRRSTP